MWSYPPGSILVPVDFSDASGRAVEVAGALSATLGARLRVLHAEVLEAPPYFTHDQIAALERSRVAARAHAREYVAGFAATHGAVGCDVVLADGSAAPAIIHAAAGADLVVMGTHGRRGPSLWWLGSVAERVVHESRTPVLVLRSDSASGQPAEIFRRPLIVAPARAFEGNAVRLAEGLAGAFGGRVAEKAAACEADLAEAREATMVVVARSANGGIARDASERWIRSCTLPMLFVPGLER